MKLMYSYYCTNCNYRGEIPNLFGTFMFMRCPKCGENIEIIKED